MSANKETPGSSTNGRRPILVGGRPYNPDDVWEEAGARGIEEGLRLWREDQAREAQEQARQEAAKK